MPLANIFIPANTRQYFNIMMDIVSFDYFPLTEVIDFGFTKTDPWSKNFEWLSYDSINFMESMGSISLWIFIGLLFALVVFILSAFKINMRYKWIKKLFAPISLGKAAITAMQGTLFEIMISASIGVMIFELHEYWNIADKMCVAFQIFVSLMVVAFFGFVIFYSSCKIRKINFLELSSRLEHYQSRVDFVDEKFK